MIEALVWDLDNKYVRHAHYLECDRKFPIIFLNFKHFHFWLESESKFYKH